VSDFKISRFKVAHAYQRPRGVDPHTKPPIAECERTRSDEIEHYDEDGKNPAARRPDVGAVRREANISHRHFLGQHQLSYGLKKD